MVIQGLFIREINIAPATIRAAEATEAAAAAVAVAAAARAPQCLCLTSHVVVALALQLHIVTVLYVACSRCLHSVTLALPIAKLLCSDSNLFHALFSWISLSCFHALSVVHVCLSISVCVCLVSVCVCVHVPAFSLHCQQ